MKISDSEWPAIAARRHQGEPVAAIARSYDCSPAVIYGILKRHKPSLPEAVEAVVAQLSANGSGAEPEAMRPSVVTPAAEPSASGEAAAAPNQQTTPLSSDTPRQERGFPYRRTTLAEPVALTAEFDTELRSEVAAAIAAFEGAFDAALDDRRSENVELLRRAASDLMRAGARTAIVLERLMSATKAPSAPRRAESSSQKRRALAERQSAIESTASPDGLELSPGTVKWFSPAKAFGFIQMDAGGGDVFVNSGSRG